MDFDEKIFVAKSVSPETSEYKSDPRVITAKIDNLKGILYGSIVVMCISIFMLTVDILRDNNVNSRISELEREIADYKKENFELNEKSFSEKRALFDEFSKQQKVIECLKISQYWQYQRCF